jgi:hypothetical protein
MEIMAALRRRDEKQLMRLQSAGRWILRDLIHGGWLSDAWCAVFLVGLTMLV